MKFREMSICDQMDFCARWLLIHSIAYYDLDINMVSDAEYDNKLKWLCSYSVKHSNEINKCYYANLITNLDPCSGFYMKKYVTNEHYNYIQKITNHIYSVYKQNKR